MPVSLAPKLLPVTVTIAPVGPVVGLIEIAGVTLKVMPLTEVVAVSVPYALTV